MKRLATIIVLTFSLIAIPSFAAVTAGSKCSKAGQVTSVKGIQFKCVKKNSKLTWQKVVENRTAAPAVSPTPTTSPSLISYPTPTVSPTPIATPTPTPTPSKKALPNNWPLDKAATDDLALIADAAIRNYISSATLSPKINLLTGPNTDKLKAKDYIRFLEKAATGWGKDWMPAEVDVALANVSDYEWMKPLWPQYGLRGTSFDDSKANWERNGNQCNQGSAIYDVKPFFWGCMPSDPGNFIGLNKFGPHEYTHLAQNAIIYYQSGKKVWNLPVLFSEGSADFYGVTYASTPDNAEQNWRAYWIGGYISSEARAALKQASAADIESLLVDSMTRAEKVNSHWYWTGAYATMRLVAAQGHEGFLKFMRNFGETADVFKSFETVYGMKFEAFAKLIAPEIKALTPLLRN